MFSRRLAAATLVATLMTAMLAAPTMARRPLTPTREPPLTAADQLASDRKVAASDAYLASVALAAGDVGTLGCLTPSIAATSDSTTGEATTAAATTAATCTVPQGYLSVSARDQERAHYCGPATGQVITNYSWAMPANANKYTQRQLAGWMRTDLTGQTDAGAMEDGLEVATARAPRRPAGWDWVVTSLVDRNGNGTVGDDLQGFVRSNVSNSKMPLAIPVKPHDPDSRYHLASWSRPVESVGHWIAVYGWYSNYTGTDFARIYYTDSSRDEGGSTGWFWDPTRHIAILMLEHTRRLVW